MLTLAETVAEAALALSVLLPCVQLELYISVTEMDTIYDLLSVKDNAMYAAAGYHPLSTVTFPSTWETH